MKKCSKCLFEKDVSYFAKESKKKDGLRSVCRECDSKRWKIYGETNRDKLREKDRLYHEKNRENDDYIKRKLLKGAKLRAKEMEREFSLSYQDLPEKIPEKCPILGIDISVGRGKSHANSPSLDRIDPNKGYTRENYQIISHRANTLKNNATVDELKKIVAFMESKSEERKESSIW